MSNVKIIAEMCCNHMGSLKIAKEMIAEAAACGVDFVKFQKRDLDSIKDPDYPRRGEHSFGVTNYEHRLALEFDENQWEDLKIEADRRCVGMFATPFDVKSVDFCLDIMKFDILKLGSTQIHDEVVMRYCKAKAKNLTVIVSTGMCDQTEVTRVVNTFGSNVRLVVMHTTSAYPCPNNQVNLNVLTAGEFLNRESGLSGHYTSGSGAIEAAAVALGATWIERHFTLDRTWKGSDQVASLEPSGMARVIRAVRSVEDALGSRMKSVLDCEIPTMKAIGLC